MFGRILMLLALLFTHAALSAGTLNDIHKSGTIHIAHPENTRPFSYFDNGEPTGYSINLCRQIVDDIASQLGLDNISIKWRTASTPEALRLVADGVVDMDCGITSITLSRQQRVDFSNEIYVATGDVLVHADSGIKGLAGLAGKKVAVIRGTTTDTRLAKALEQQRIGAKLVPVSSTEDGIRALDLGKADAYAGDRTVLLGMVKAADNSSGYALLSELYSIDPYAFALPRGDADFRLAVNRALSDIYRNASLEQVYGRWFGPGSEPSQTLRTIYILNAYQD